MRRAWGLVGWFGLALCAGGARAEDDDPSALFPVVVFDGDSKPTLPTSDNAQVTASKVAGKACVLLGLPAAGWGRAWWNDLPRDVRAFAHLDLEFRSVSGTPAPLEVVLGNGSVTAARLPLDPPSGTWEKRRLDLGDFHPESGFDPTQVTSLTLVWHDPRGAGVALANVTFVPGAGGWRHVPREEMKRIYGPKRARDVRQASTEHFEVFSDGPKSVAALGAALEKDALGILFLLGAPKEALAGYKLPVYAFRSATDYHEYLMRVLGYSERQAQAWAAAGTSWALFMVAQEGGNPVWRHRLALAILQHVYGWGGGAWFHDGAAEYCVRRLANRPVAKEMAPRAKSGEHWKLPELLGATSLYPTGPEADASYDIRPAFLHAASVVEYLLRVPPAEPAAATPVERVQARIRAICKVTEQGWGRIEALTRVMAVGTPEEFEAGWKAWVLAAR